MGVLSRYFFTRPARALAVALFGLMLGVHAIGPADAADFSRGLSAYENGDFATALKEWQPLAESGDVAAMRNLGHLYRWGRGVKLDQAKAARWYERAAERGFDRAQANLASLYLAGEGVAKNQRLAAQWFARAARQGHAIAQYDLGLMYEHGIGVGKDTLRALGLFILSAKSGHPMARTRVVNLMQGFKGNPTAVADAEKLVGAALAALSDEPAPFSSAAPGPAPSDPAVSGPAISGPAASGKGATAPEPVRPPAALPVVKPPPAPPPVQTATPKPAPAPVQTATLKPAPAPASAPPPGGPELMKSDNDNLWDILTRDPADARQRAMRVQRDDNLWAMVSQAFDDEAQGGRPSGAAAAEAAVIANDASEIEGQSRSSELSQAAEASPELRQPGWWDAMTDWLSELL